MSFNAALNRLIREYPKATTQPFKGNELADFIRKKIPKYVSEIIGDNAQYLVEGSPGKGQWAYVPWVAVLDRFITETVQDGYYIVYLVKEDFSGVYLSLNQGVTTVQNQYGSETKAALTTKSNDYLARLGKLKDGYIQGKINLAVTEKSKLGPLYEVGSICSLFYPSNNIPSDAELKKDLQKILKLYSDLTGKEGQLFNSNEAEEDEISLEYEDLKKVRVHKRIERNKKLADKVKKLKGCTCEACGFNFEEKYGELGKGFIEAHHLKPLHTYEDEKVALDPIKDFAVLCSNCHRMVHKSGLVSEISDFRARHILKYPSAMK